MDEKELEALKESNPKAYEHIMKTKGELEDLKKKATPPKKEDPPKENDPDDEDLNDKARKAKEAQEKEGQKTKELETALKFNLGVSDFVKSHKDLLSTEVEDVIKQADKETYDSAIEKASAMKAGIVKAFFSVQANIDDLSASRKAKIEDYLKLTAKGRAEKAADVYEIFEDAIETLKKVKKAQELGKASGGHTGSKHENAYKEKLMNVSRKTHLGEKGV